MFLEFLKFDLRFQARTPLLWIGIALFAFAAFGATTSDSVQIGGSIGNVHRNAPFVIVQWLNIFTILGLFISAAFIGGTLLRDFEMNTSELFFSKPIRARDYLLGRYAAGVVVSMLIYLAICAAILLGTLMPWIEAERLGAFSPAPYLYGLLVFGLPNLIFSGALIMLFAALTRSMLGVYLAILVFLVTWAMAGSMTRDLDNLWLATLVDPFGARALSVTTRYWTAEDRNTLLPDLTGYILANRVFWMSLAAVLMGITLRLFRTDRAGTSSWFKRRKSAAPAAGALSKPISIASLTIAPPSSKRGFSTAWRQFLKQAQFDTMQVLRSVPFKVMIGFGLLNLIGAISAPGPMYDTPLYPVTNQMLLAMQQSYTWILMLIVMFYAGELVWRDRAIKLDGVVDAFAVPNWVPIAAKAVAIVAIVAVAMTIGALWCMGYQLIQGYTRFEIPVYVTGLAIASVSYVLVGWMSIVLQVITNHKFIGYLATISIMVSWTVLGALDLDHNLLSFAQTSATPHSDMNGFGHTLIGFSWFSIYWTLFTLAALLLAAAFWVRGLPEPFKARMRMARQRMRGGLLLAFSTCLAGTAASAGYIYYNTNVLNTYRASDTQLDFQAAYERKYRSSEDVAQPRVIDVDSTVLIDPYDRRVAIEGRYQLKNKSAAPISQLHLELNPAFHELAYQLEGATLKERDDEFGVSIYTLDPPLPVGGEVTLGFRYVVQPRGFPNSGLGGRIHYNGTFFDSLDHFPHFGYQRGREIVDRNERRERDLGEPRRMPKLDQPKRDQNYIDDDSDWIQFASTVCTAPDQIALAPGYLQREWNEDGRRCFRYQMDAPILGFWAYLSARWEVKRETHDGIQFEVYYDPKHPYNVDRMLSASRKSLDYYSKHFGPFQHRQFRILEFPGYATFAQAFPNTIPYSEAIGFIAKVDDKDAVDYVFYITAHEAAHQWWAHQVIGAESQGSTLMVETLAQYSALMVMEQEYGEQRMRKFLKYELDEYLTGRGGEILEELPLNQVESNQGYVHYRKGSLVMYRLQEELGEDVVNEALRTYLARVKFQEPPYTISTELIDAFRAVAPADKQQLITDLFERITFYDNRTETVTAKKREDGKYEVRIDYRAAKLESDGIGKEEKRALDDAIDVGVFAKPEGEDEARVLYLQKHPIRSDQGSITVVVDEEPYEAGLDPMNKLIDRVSRDNRKRVTLETE